MEKKKASWVKPAGVPGLLGRKKVDWSCFEDGTTIPDIFIEEFVRANGGMKVLRGTHVKIKLIVEGESFAATLQSSDRKKGAADITQIRYDSNGSLKQLLRNRLSQSYEYIRGEREKKKAIGKKLYVKVPAHMAEYMEFYETEKPFYYRVELLTRPLSALEERQRLKEEGRLRVEDAEARKLDLDELNTRARKAPRTPMTYLTPTTRYVRDPYVSELAKRLANGICQLCEQPAPFMDNNGRSYLETHHIMWLARGGEDTVENTVALCPNCHKRMHVLDLEEDISKLLKVWGK